MKKKILWTLVGVISFVPTVLISCSKHKKINSDISIPPAPKPIPTTFETDSRETKQKPTPNPVLPKPQPPRPVKPQPLPKAKVHKDTKIKDQISIEHLSWENKTLNNLNKAELQHQVQNEWEKFIFENKDQLFLGEKSYITTKNDLEVTIVEEAKETEFALLVKVKENKWFKGNNPQIEKLEQKVKIINFQQLPTQLDNTGGTLADNKLFTNKYKNIVDLFNLNHSMAMTDLTNKYFNNILQKTNEFKQLIIEIKEGSTSKGNLCLNLKGIYKSQNINDHILINNFSKSNVSSKIIIKNVSLNESNWFKDLKPIYETSNKEAEIKEISSDDWINRYVDNFDIYDENGHHKITNFQSAKKDGIMFRISASLNQQENEIIFTINGNYKSKKYDSITKKWVDENNSESKIESLARQGGSRHLFNKTDVENYLLNKTEVNEEIIKNNYPSYFLAFKNYFEILNSNFTINNLFTNPVFDKLNNRYLNWRKEAVSYEIKNIEANDFSNALKFQIGFIVEDEKKLNNFKEFSFSNKNKNINEKEIIKKDQINKITTNSDFNKNLLLQKIKKFLKTNYKNDIDKLFAENQNKKLDISNRNKNEIIPPIFNLDLFLTDNEHSFQQKLEIIKKYFNPSLFSNELKISYEFDRPDNQPNGNWNFKSGLYELNGEKFVIEYIKYIFSEKIDIHINKNTESHNAITISIKMKTEVGFADNETREYDSVLSIIMLKDQWEKEEIKKK